MGQAIAKFFAAVRAKLAGFSRGVRTTAADCTSARLHHS
jgi:hypothetical protein